MHVFRSRNHSRRSTTGLGAGTVATKSGLIALVVVGVFAVTGCAAGTAQAESSSAASPTTTVGSRGGLDAGQMALVTGSGPVRLDVYVDMMCPFCASFDAAQRDAIDGWLAGETVTVAIHPLNFLDRESLGASYSTRAATALATTAAESPADLLTFMSALFERQPAEQTRGLSDGQIVEAAPEAVRATVASALDSRPYDAWLDRGTMTTMSGRDAVRSTPSVRIDGVTFDGDLRGAGFREAVEAAARG